MSRVEDYLAISPVYCRWLGDLRWYPDGEAVEYACDGPEVGMTFAMATEIAQFLEGFQTVARPISFSLVLHLLHLLGLGSRMPRAEPPRTVAGLRKAFHESGRKFRNAGALCAMLSRKAPRDPGAPEIGDVCLALNRSAAGWAGVVRAERRGVVPPLDPDAFEALVLGALADLAPQDVRHWLRFGRGPVGESAGRVAQELPASLPSALEALARRPRLAGAGPLVAQLSGALTLPPRRLAASELPSGGYSDVATRGRPEQILPGQLALDGDEFVRRFAEHELLYFHREEPRTPASEELVVVLDQGVRTWGDVRLVLAAGLLALGRIAGRRRIPLRLAATSHGRGLIDPLVVDQGELGAILEASDLTPHPGLVLERVLELPCSSTFRDVVLLTHPRTLLETDVAAAARRVAGGTRLFAITVDAQGQVELAELRRGTPVVRTRCRVAASAADAPPPPPAREAGAGTAPWTGDVETPGFPFKLGALSPIPDHLFDFDDSGEWILFAGQHGLLHAWRTDGSDIEMLPRGIHDDRPVTKIEAIVGVVGGFAVAGRNGKDEILAHYDFSGRTCRVHQLFPLRAERREWSYLRELHTVVARRGDHRPVAAVDLGAAGYSACHFGPPQEESSSKRAQWAFRLAAPGGRSVALQPATGALELRDDLGSCRSVTPMADGRPALAGCALRVSRFGGDVAAALAGDRARASIYFASVPTARLIGECPLPPEARGFALSRDGRRFAYRAGSRHIVAREVAGGPRPLAVSPKGKAHQGLDVELGDSFLTIHNGKYSHLLRWDRRTAEFRLGREGIRTLLHREYAGNPPPRVAAWRGGTPASVDSRRFVTSCRHGGRTVLVDFLGQVSVFGAGDEPVVMVSVFRDQIAAWMPDGTRLGPASLTGHAAAPGAAARIGAALAACATSGGGP